MPDQYHLAVKAAYTQKLEEPNTSVLLRDPTPGNLKKLSKSVYVSRYLIEDAPILGDFFGIEYTKADFQLIIEEKDASFFRALSENFKRDLEPHERVTEMIAWLIDFKPRPSFSFYKRLRELNDNPITIKEEEIRPEDSASGNEQTENTGREESFEGPKINPQTQEEEPREENKNTSRNIMFVLLVLLIMASSVVLWKIKQSNKDWMYWNVDHYQKIEHDNILDRTDVIPLNKEKLKNLRRITKDTLTINSFGKVWYAIIDGKKQFFTDSGMHPIDTNQVLRPVKKAMFINRDSLLQN